MPIILQVLHTRNWPACTAGVGRYELGKTIITITTVGHFQMKPRNIPKIGSQLGSHYRMTVGYLI